MRCTPILAFALNPIAYQTEILRGGIIAVVRGDIEAAKAIGMSRLKTMQRIVFPHVYRIAWPALGNDIILLMNCRQPELLISRLLALVGMQPHAPFIINV